MRITVQFDTAGFMGSTPLTGAAARTFYLNERLANQGHGIHLLLTDLNPASRPTSDWPFDVTYVRPESLYGPTSALGKEIENLDVEVLVMSTTSVVAHHGPALAHQLDAALIYEMHDDEASLMEQFDKPRREVERARTLQQKAIRSSSRTVCFTHKDAAVARSLGGRAVDIVPCGTRPPHVDAQYNTNSAVLTFLGNMYYEPNRRACQFLTSPSFLQLLEESDLTLRIIGRTPGETIASHPRIELVGDVEDPLHHLESAVLGLAPLEVGSGMKIKILDYMSAGIPTVATPLAAEGFEGFRQLGWIAPSMGDFVATVERALGDRPGREEKAAACRRRSSTEYSWESRARQAADVYASASAGPSAPPALGAAEVADVPYWLEEFEALR